MPDQQHRYESMLFNYETTNLTDYRDGEIKPPVATIYKKKSSCMRIRPPGLKFTHTLTDWREPNIPFGLFSKPKDIIRVDPRKVQGHFSKEVDVSREEVQKSRPRLVMSPAVSMDDVGDKSARALLVRDIYSTSTGLAQQLAFPAPPRCVRSPMPGLPAPADALSLPKLRPYYLSPEWRMLAARWDADSLRAHQGVLALPPHPV